MSYTTDERTRAAAWKAHTAVLPAEAKQPAHYVGKDGTAGPVRYDFCLPATLAEHNLLPSVRERALALFAELGIPWHAGVGSGPSNHLLSSQVQCVNALAAMVDDPARMTAAFGRLLGIGEVEQIEPGRYLTFEYIGPTDFFGEAPSGARRRGAHCTSVDAAFRHRALDGSSELVLLEWKYTESYPLRRPDPARDAIRRRRYAAAVADPAGPVRADVLALDLLLDEPFYQLVRQQLLAHALERAGVADRVRVVHVLPPANTAYQESLHRPEHQALGETVSQVWQQLLRRPERYTSIDPALFCDPAITSEEYVLRYSADVVWNQADLLTALGDGEPIEPDDVEDAFDFEHDLEWFEGELVLRVGTVGHSLPYPYRLQDLYAFAAEVEQEASLEDGDEADGDPW